jgi:hypothetical protein
MKIINKHILRASPARKNKKALLAGYKMQKRKKWDFIT